MEELERRGFSNAAMRQWTFENDNGKCPQMDNGGIPFDFLHKRPHIAL